jgi:methionine sulfoxide reductase catalytic subunit
MNQRIKYLPYSMVTPRSVYLNRRRFLASTIAASAASQAAAAAGLNFVKSPLRTTEKQTPYQAITTYNNY